MATTKAAMKVKKEAMKMRGEILTLQAKQIELKEALAIKRQNLKDHVEATKKT